MEISSYFTFILIAFGYIASPGPAVFIAINGGASLGKKKTFDILLGNTLGLGIVAFISALGVGSLILNSNILSIITTAVGALWLCYMGIKMIVSNVSISRKNVLTDGDVTYIERIRSGFILAITNPKPIIFFVSIYPQFVVSNNTKYMQLLLLGLTFMVLSISTLNFYSYISNKSIGKFLDDKNIRYFNMFFGVVFLFLGLLLVFPIIHRHFS